MTISIIRSTLRSRLFRKIAGVLLTIVILVFGVTSFVMIIGADRLLVDQQELASIGARNELKARMDSWLMERLADVRTLARVIKDPQSNPVPKGLLESALEYQSNPMSSFTKLMVVDPEGRILAVAPDKENLINDERIGDLLNHLGSNNYVISDPMYNHASRHYEAVISIPLSQAEVPPALLAYVSLEPLMRMCSFLRIQSNSRAYVTNAQGYILGGMDLSPSPSPSGIELGVLPNKELSLKRSGSGTYASFDNQPVVGAWITLSNISLGLVVENPISSIIEPTVILAIAICICFALAVIILLWIVFSFSKSFIEPIENLSEGFKKVQSNTDALLIESNTRTEFDNLAEEFNVMLRFVKEREDHLRATASQDSLTGLYNHRNIEEFLGIELKRKRRSGDKICFIMIDIDNFKHVNDRYGHLAGDEVLRKIARILDESARAGDITGRYGGEEFSVILDANSDDVVHSFCERIRHNVERTVFVSGDSKIRVTVSLGWYCGHAEGLEPYDVVRNADRALYAAKASGRNRTISYESIR